MIIAPDIIYDRLHDLPAAQQAVFLLETAGKHMAQEILCAVDRTVRGSDLLCRYLDGKMRRLRCEQGAALIENIFKRCYDLYGINLHKDNIGLINL